MSLAWQFYISTLLIYLGVDVIAVLGAQPAVRDRRPGQLRLHHLPGRRGLHGCGAHARARPAAGTAGSSSTSAARLPFPLPILAAGLVGGLLAALVGGLTVRRLRTDYQAMVMLVVSLIATSVATNQVGLVNGPNGLSLVPKPLASLVNLRRSVTSGSSWG